jgi:mono/diheme cytochrome c family protein
MRRVHDIGMATVCAILALTIGSGITAATAQEQKQPPPKIKQETYKGLISVEGKDTFAAVCAACHGTDGKGQGPVAPALAKPVPDLTRMAERNKGKFDDAAAHAAVYGKGRMPAAHGTVDMPIWGPIFERGDIYPQRATLRIKNLIDYLESIQQK